MELTQLRYFKVLAENVSLSKAAEKLYITPPALSSAISRLERDLGTTLFDRGKTLVLNERGHIFLNYVNQSLDALDTAMAVLKEMDGVYQTQLSVAVSTTAVWHDMFLAFMEKYPNINLSQSFISVPPSGSDDVLSQFDFIITAPGDLSTENLHSITLYNDDMPMLMVREDNPFLSMQRVALSDVREESFIAPSAKTSSRRYFDEMFSIAGFKPRIVTECGPEMRHRLVREGRGIGLVTAHTKRFNTDPEIRFIEINNPIYRRSQALYWHAKRHQTYASRCFRTFAVDFFKSGIKAAQ